MKIKSIALFVSLIFSVACFVGCTSSQRDYHDDIVVTLENTNDRIIIKEWQYLLGSGAEIYYQKESDTPVLLGKTSGGDDGFCPFNEGLYEINKDGDTVTVKWCFDPSDNDKSNWRSKTFEIVSE